MFLRNLMKNFVGLTEAQGNAYSKALELDWGPV